MQLAAGDASHFPKVAVGRAAQLSWSYPVLRTPNVPVYPRQP